MYDQTSILALENRIGFGKGESLPIAIDPSNQVGDSGRVITWFHKLASIDNLFNTIAKEDTLEVPFNDYLSQVRTDAVKYVLTAIFDKNPKYIFDFDYSFWITDRPALFDDAIGYSMAISAIEEMVTTSRSNDQERNARLSYDKLKIELDGIKDSYGNVMSSGLKRAQYSSVRNAAEIIFPNPLIIESPKVW